MNFNDIDYDDVAVSEFRDLNDGVYSVVVDKMLLKRFPGDKQPPVELDPTGTIQSDAFIETHMQVIDGERKGFVYKENLYTFDTEIKGRISRANLLKIANAVGYSKEDLTELNDMEAKFKNKPFKIELKSKAGKNGNIYQNIFSIRDVNGNKMSLTGGAAKVGDTVQGTTATTTTVAVSNDANKAPWEEK